MRPPWHVPIMPDPVSSAGRIAPDHPLDAGVTDCRRTAHIERVLLPTMLSVREPIPLLVRRVLPAATERVVQGHRLEMAGCLDSPDELGWLIKPRTGVIAHRSCEAEGVQPVAIHP